MAQKRTHIIIIIIMFHWLLSAHRMTFLWSQSLSCCMGFTVVTNSSSSTKAPKNIWMHCCLDRITMTSKWCGWTESLYVSFGLKKEDFLENLHILSCFVQLKSILLMSCVFCIPFGSRLFQGVSFQLVFSCLGDRTRRLDVDWVSWNPFQFQ